MGRKGSYVIHSFYCTKCGNKNYELPRKVSHKHAAGHLKKLYCIHCRQEVNNVECVTPEDENKFKQDFAEGVYDDAEDLPVVWAFGLR